METKFSYVRKHELLEKVVEDLELLLNLEQKADCSDEVFIASLVLDSDKYTSEAGAVSPLAEMEKINQMGNIRDFEYRGFQCFLRKVDGEWQGNLDGHVGIPVQFETFSGGRRYLMGEVDQFIREM